MRLPLALLLTILMSSTMMVHTASAANVSQKELNELMTLVKDQKKQLNEQKRQIAEHQKKLETQQQQYDALQKKISGMSEQASQVADRDDEPAPEKTASTADAAPAADQMEVGTERKTEDEEKPPAIAANIDEGGVLLKKGTLMITPAMEYSSSSSTLVSVLGASILNVVNIGTFQISTVSRDVITGSIASRLGVTNRFEIEGKVPYVYRRDVTTGRPLGSSNNFTSELTNEGIGDVEVGAHYQINKGKDGWPFFISNIRLKSTTGTGPFEIPTDGNGLLTSLPTGSGFYAIQPSVTAIYPSDPVVYYSNLGYLYNIERDFGGTVGTVDPGDSVSASFGMSMSLNDHASFSLGYSHSTVFETMQNGRSINNGMLQVGTFDLGYAYQLSDRYSLNFSVSAGMTEDAPDARVGLRVPIKFDVF